MEKSDKRNFKEKKEKKAQITWEDNDINSSSDLENKFINLGLNTMKAEKSKGYTLITVAPNTWQEMHQSLFIFLLKIVNM